MLERLMQNNPPKYSFLLRRGALSCRSLFWLFLKEFPWKKIMRVLDIGIKFKREFSFLTQLVCSYFKLYCAKSIYNGRQKDYCKAPPPPKKKPYFILTWEVYRSGACFDYFWRCSHEKKIMRVHLITGYRN